MPALIWTLLAAALLCQLALREATERTALGLTWVEALQVDDPDAGPFELQGHEGEVTCVDWCRQDMAHLASVADDATVRVWQINRPFPPCQARRIPRKVIGSPVPHPSGLALCKISRLMPCLPQHCLPST